MRLTPRLGYWLQTRERERRQRKSNRFHLLGAEIVKKGRSAARGIVGDRETEPRSSPLASPFNNRIVRRWPKLIQLTKPDPRRSIYQPNTDNRLRQHIHKFQNRSRVRADLPVFLVRVSFTFPLPLPPVPLGTVNVPAALLTRREHASSPRGIREVSTCTRYVGTRHLLEGIIIAGCG